MDRGQITKKEKHPRETTNIISKFSFFYILKLLKKGYRKGLEFCDIYEVLTSCRSEKLGNRLEQEWEREKSKQKNPSLSRALFSCFGKTFIILGLIQLIVRLIMTVWLPYALSKFILYFNPGQNDLTKDDAIYYACIVVGLKIFNLLFYNNFLLYVLALGLSVKAAVSSIIYRKSLRLKYEALSNVTVGKITTIVNRDVEIFQQFISQGNEIWISLVQTVLICCLIYNKIGVASWSGITFFFIVLPLQMYIGKLAYNFRFACSKKTDDRLKQTQEMLMAIKVIKMYTWEQYFERKIYDARKEELAELYKLFYSRVWISVIGNICSKVAFFIFVMTYVWFDDTVTAETVYYILSCFVNLQRSLSNGIPFGFSKTAEVYAVIKRCEKILKEPEMSPMVQPDEILCPHIHFSDVSVKICGQTVLKNISLDINKGLNIVVGHVGSGKSSLLKAIMQEYDTEGDVRVYGSISYVSEEPWLFPSTIKSNILFGEKYFEKRYHEVLKICSLDYDLKFIDDGDNTIIGDRGVNLSKGQRARVSLARALYKNSDIYLLDDCLASLDAHVSDHIFKQCIQKFLREKIVIFVTSNFDYVHEADEVISLEHGKMSCNHNLDKKILAENILENDLNGKFDEYTEKTPIYNEKKNSGKVSISDYYKYVSYGGGFIVFCFIMGLFTAHQGFSSYSEKLLSNWVTLEQNISNIKILNQTENLEYQDLYKSRNFSFSLYCGVFTTAIVFYIISAFTYFFFIKRASTNLHKAMLTSIINAPMRFFDTNFIGNILTRFSKDCVTVDEHLPFAFMECLMMVFVASGGVILLSSVDYIFLIENIVLIILAYLLKRFCQPTGRNLQRLHVMARCPMIGHVNSSLAGLSTIRVSNAQKMIIREFDRYQDQFTSTHYMLDNTMIALTFSIELISTLLIGAIIIQFLNSDSDPSIGDVGLAINQAFTISEITSNGIMLIFDCENLMTCVERILEYVRLEQEDKKGDYLKDWPESGSVKFHDVSLNYGNITKQILKGLTFSVTPKEKLGIVGRTGAGKSSIVSSLMRLYKTGGKITIDNVDIQSIALGYLRSNISVIPQDPFIFTGTIRENLDPFHRNNDEQIWKVLKDLHLHELIEDLNLEVDKSATLSAGQKQLLCLARVILQKNKIVILDEATANVDQETDNMIHKAVLNNFAECTVIIVAHRLSAVLDCDNVIVMKNGEISEYDKPSKLLENKNSFFHRFVK